MSIEVYQFTSEHMVLHLIMADFSSFSQSELGRPTKI